MKKFLSNKKILTIIGGIVLIGIVASIISSVVTCSTDSKGSTNYPPEETTEFLLVLNDGTDVSQRVSTSKSQLDESILRRDGYTFLGVFSSTTDGIQFYNAKGYQTSVPHENETLYAQWQVNTYQIVFTAGDDVINNNSSVVYGTSMPSIFPIPSVIPAGKEFVGWQNDRGELVSDESGTPSFASLTSEHYNLNEQNKTVRLTAVFKIKTYKVTYVFLGGKTVTKEVVSDSTLVLPETEEENGYEFRGWSRVNSPTNPVYYDNEPINADTTLYAIYLQYKEIQLVNGKDVLATERIYNDGKSIILNTIEVELPKGYCVEGWYSNESMSGSSAVTSVSYGTSYTTFYADVQPVKYTVTFILGDGETCDRPSVQYTIESGASLPLAVKTNYTFIGWCADEELETAVLTEIPKGEIGERNLYPKFKGKDVKLTLDEQNGASPKSVTKEFGKEYTLSIPSRSGYFFLGWFDSADGGVQYADSTGNSLKALDLAKDMTLYAQWEKKYFVHVTVSPSGLGNVNVEEYYFEGDEVTLTLPTPQGYNLLGWYNQENQLGFLETYTFTMPAEDVDLELKFEPKSYTVTFDCLDGEYDGTPVAVTYGEPFQLPKVIKPAYKFVGWQYNDTTLTDGEGKSLENWNITENVTVTAILVQADVSNGIFIYDSATLLKVKENPSANYQFVYNVDMDGVEWTPFEFKGKIVGNGFTVKNLTVSPSTARDTGVFTSVSGTIENLVFENLNVTLTASDYLNPYAVGGVCGTLNGTLKNVTVKSGQIIGGTKFSYAGGLVGSMSGGSIKNCENYASVTSKCDYGAGGIVARFTGGSIENCENYGAVTGTDYVGGICGRIAVSGNYSLQSLTNSGEVSGNDYVGGIFGHLNDYVKVDRSDSPSYTLTITDLNNSGNVKGEDRVGGVMGSIYAVAENNYGYGRYALMKITAAYLTNTGNVTGQSAVGGLMGYCYSNDSGSTLTNGTSSGTIEAEYYVGGLAGKIENVKMVDCSNANTVLNATGYYLNTDEGKYYEYAGGYAGLGYAFENCENDSAINYTSRGIYVGGIVGYATGTITKCTNTAQITATDSNYVGGIAGYIGFGGTQTLSGLTNSGEVSGNDYVGGIFGHLNDYITVDRSDSPTYTLTITNLNNSGNVKGVYRVGGVMGSINAGANNNYGYGRHAWMKIAAAYLTNTGNVTGQSAVGGLMGYCYSDENTSTLTNGTSCGTIEAEYYIGGLAGQIFNVKMVDCSNANTVLIAKGFYLDETRRGYIGGYAGLGYAFENCENAVNITYTAGGSDVGGIAGNASGTVVNCKNTANIIASESNYVGGLVGYIGFGGTRTLSGLTNSGEVSGNNYVGGIFGHLNDYIKVDQSDSPTYTLTIKNLSNSGNVTGKDRVGGVIGSIYAAAENNYGYGRYARMKIAAAFISNEGDVTANSNVGGLFGYATSNESSSSIMEYTQTGNVTGTENVDTLIGYKQNISFKN